MYVDPDPRCKGWLIVEIAGRGGERGREEGEERETEREKKKGEKRGQGIEVQGMPASPKRPR